MPSPKVTHDAAATAAIEKSVGETAAIGGVNFGSGDRVQLVEQEFLFKVLDAATYPGQMIDVGAHFGGSLAPFANAGWSVLAFEPDPKNRKKLEATTQGNGNVEIVPAAVGDHEANAVPIYSSAESSGISGLTPFRDTHKQVAQVPLVTLGAEIERRQIQKVDLLKIDVEGYEMAVLRGMDFNRVKPRAVMVEYEDSKTEGHGYKADDLARLLVAQGYTVLVSEWWPIVRYGVRHSWRRLRPYPCTIPTDGWGNLIGFQESPARSKMSGDLHPSLSFPDDAHKVNEILGNNRGGSPVGSTDGGAQARGSGITPSPDQPADPGLPHTAAGSSGQAGTKDWTSLRFAPWFKGYLVRHMVSATLIAALVVALCLCSAFLPSWSWVFSIGAMSVAGLVAVAIAHDFLLQSLRLARRETASRLAEAMAETSTAVVSAREEMAGSLNELRRELVGAQSAFKVELFTHLTSRVSSLKNEILGRNTALAATVSGFQAEVDERLGVLEFGLDSARNEFESASHAQSRELRKLVSETIRELREHVTDRFGASEQAVNNLQIEAARQLEALRLETQKREGELEEGIAKAKAEVEALDTRLVAARNEALVEIGIRYSAAVSEAERRVEVLRAEMFGNEEKWAAEAGNIRADFHDRMTTLANGIERLNADTQSNQTSARNLNSLFQRLNGANAAKSIPHQRFLSTADAKRFEEHWAPIFKLSTSARAVSYLAHQICRIEDSIDGRLATTISAAVLRVLAIRSLEAKQIDILEIGTLFGVSAGMLVRLGAPDGRKVMVTMIDPLTGYYGETAVDPQTGIPVNRTTLESNLRKMGVKPSNYQIFEGFSHDPEIVTKVTSRRYDFVLIDGDHTYEGVAKDFELYGSAVRPGGLLIFDDYDTPEWPAIKAFVDERVMKHSEWEFLGGEWRTGIFRARGVGAESGQAPGPERQPVERLGRRVPKKKLKGQ